MNRADLEEVRLFVGVGVINVDRNLLFQQVSGLHPAFPLEREFFFVRFELSVDSSGGWL